MNSPCTSKAFLYLLLALVVALPANTAAQSLNLATDGATNYMILIPELADAPILTAARELQEHLQKVTGAAFPIVTDSSVQPEQPCIVVGPCRQLAAILPDVQFDQLPPDAIVMKSVDRHLVLAGQPPRGTLYAVYTFLEDIVGCRWWTSQESDIPRKPTLDVPQLDIQHAPSLRYREAFYRDTFSVPFAARLKLNGHHHNVPVEYGGHQRFVGFVHSFFPLLPPDKYFASHPEWYSEIDGKRTAEYSQLCLTNETMRREMVKVVRERLRSQPDAGLISISQNDWHGQCQCSACQAVEREEDSAAGPLIRFVNAVAADIEQEFPHILVETLAYQYTRKPPRSVQPRRNVIVRLCSIECSFVQPLAAGPHNETFRRDIEGWSAIAPQLFVWDYVTNFSNYIVPHPNLRVLAPNVRFFTENRVVGLFEQGDAQSSIGDFIRLRAWLLAHLMWNPALDEQALIREFLAGYYGAAAPHLQEYLDLTHDAAEHSGVYLNCFMTDTSKYLPLSVMNDATRLFAKAEAAVAGDPLLAPRVRRERLPLDHVWLLRYDGLRVAAKVSGEDFLGPADPVLACDEFVRVAREFGAGNYRENGSFDEHAAGLQARFRPLGPPPEACRDLPADRWIDFQDNQFRLASPGTWTALVDDPQASDGKAVRMPGDHFEWATSLPLSQDLALQNPWHCYVVARVETTAPDGTAMTMGIYDTEHRAAVAQHTITVSDAAGGTYRVYDLGAHELSGNMYVWIAPPKRPGEVQAVYVDRVYLIRE